MKHITQIYTLTLVATALLFAPTPSLYAQAVDAVGHYEGAISSPAGEMAIQIDFTKSAEGAVVGTLTIPSQKLKGFPLTNVSVGRVRRKDAPPIT